MHQLITPHVTGCQVSIDQAADKGEVSVVFKSRADADSQPSTPQRTPTHPPRQRHATVGNRSQMLTSHARIERHVTYEGQSGSLQNVWVRQQFKQFVGVCCFHLWASMLQ